MNASQNISSNIELLPLEERAALVFELCGWSDDAWQQQMMNDAKSGKFEVLN